MNRAYYGHNGTVDSMWKYYRKALFCKENESRNRVFYTYSFVLYIFYAFTFDK